MGQTMIFNQWLKQRRKALGLTQKELAQQAGCAEVTLRKIEAGDFHPSAPLAASLARAVGATDVDLPSLVTLARGLDTDLASAARQLVPSRPHNLPLQLTPLLGRDHDIAALRKRLRAGERLITLLGPPGVGKTRLAQAVAEEVLEQFEDGAFFVRLAPISDPDLVAATIAQALGLQMSGSNSAALQLRAYLEEKHLLLVLDNFEQIIEAAPLVDDLLRRCAWLHVLVTSRQPLRVRGERQAPVRPLALPAELPGASQPTASDVLRYSAVALFEERAGMVQPDFAVTDDNATAVAELCRRLDGLPLAIELVAARVRLLSPAELLARLHGPWLLSMDGLRDVSARQKTLRSAIGWSYGLLTPLEQTLFTRLAVFVGGCTLEAAELLCGDALSPPLPLPLSPAQVLDGIASLLDKSLLFRETGRYGAVRYAMLETMREYGLERLATSGEDATLRARHARCFLRIVDNVDQAEINPRKLQLNRLIDDEIHNLSAALDWFKRHDVQAAMILTTHLLLWYGQRGPREEGRRLIDEVLGLPEASAHTIHRARMLFEAGILMIQNDEFAKALEYEEESLLLSEETGDSKGKADALLGLGRVAWVMADWNRAFFYLENALAVYRAVRDPGGTAYSLALLANVTFNIGRDISRARALAQESLAVAQQTGIPFHWPLLVLGNILFFIECDLDEAQSLTESLLIVLQQEQEGGSLIAGTLFALGDLATRKGDFAAAHAHLNKGLAVEKQLGMKQTLRIRHLWFAELYQAEGDYRRAIQSYRASLPPVLCEPLYWAVYLVDLAALAKTLGMHELATRLLGAIESIEQAVGRMLPIHRQDCNRVADAVRSHLGKGIFDAALAKGRGQEFAQIAQEAISTLESAVWQQDSVLSR